MQKAELLQYKPVGVLTGRADNIRVKAGSHETDRSERQDCFEMGPVGTLSGLQIALKTQITSTPPPGHVV